MCLVGPGGGGGGGGGGGWHLACIGPEEVGQQLAKIHGTNFDAFRSFRSKSF